MTIQDALFSAGQPTSPDLLDDPDAAWATWYHKRTKHTSVPKTAAIPGTCKRCGLALIIGHTEPSDSWYTAKPAICDPYILTSPQQETTALLLGKRTYTITQRLFRHEIRNRLEPDNLAHLAKPITPASKTNPVIADHVCGMPPQSRTPIPLIDRPRWGEGDPPF